MSRVFASWFIAILNLIVHFCNIKFFYHAFKAKSEDRKRPFLIVNFRCLEALKFIRVLQLIIMIINIEKIHSNVISLKYVKVAYVQVLKCP